MALTKAIAQAETGYCKHGSAISHNNCFGTMTWKTGTREFRHFENTQAGFDYTYGLIKRKYMDMTLQEMAVKYSGNDRADTWESNVRHWYAKFI